MIAAINPLWLRRCVLIVCVVPWIFLVLLTAAIDAMIDELYDVIDDCKAAWR